MLFIFIIKCIKYTKNIDKCKKYTYNMAYIGGNNEKESKKGYKKIIRISIIGNTNDVLVKRILRRI